MIIIAEPVIGYLIPAIRKKYPAAKIATLHFHAHLHTLCQWNADYKWHIKSSILLEQFLFSLFQHLPSPRIAMIIPPYAHYIAQIQIAQLRSQISAAIDSIRSDVATVGYFGKKWIKNSIANFLFYEYILTTNNSKQYPICIVGSGATLNETIATLSKIQEHALIFALPSAISCMKAHNVCPDIVINTDGGFWATTHFYDYTSPLRVAMPLTAARELYKYHSSPFLFDQGFCIAHALNKIIQPMSICLQNHGTVAATALEMAIKMNSSHIFLFGIDGAYINGALHCHPHSFENYYSRHASLLIPSETERLSRLIKAPSAAHTKSTRILHSHEMYRVELQTLIQRSNTPIYTVATSHSSSIAPNIQPEHIIRTLHTRCIEKCEIFIKTAQQISMQDKKTALNTLLQNYQKKISVTPSTYAEENSEYMLMHALAPQEYHSFWRTQDSRRWGMLQEHCIDQLQHLINKYK